MAWGCLGFILREKRYGSTPPHTLHRFKNNKNGTQEDDCRQQKKKKSNHKKQQTCCSTNVMLFKRKKTAKSCFPLCACPSRAAAHGTSAASGVTKLLPQPQQAPPCCSAFVCSAISERPSVFLRCGSNSDARAGPPPACSRTGVTAAPPGPGPRTSPSPGEN